MRQVCLIVIYNHNYEKNISLINAVYKGRFSSIFHIMPFYRGNERNVIGVYDSSYQFNGYIAQAANQFVNEGYSHYVFVADDMVINPLYNEHNIVRELNLSDNSAFLLKRKMLDNRSVIDWRGWAIPGLLNMNSHANSAEWRSFMPSIHDARLAFEEAGLEWKNMVSPDLFEWLKHRMKINPENPYKVVIPKWFAVLTRLMLRLGFWRNRNGVEDGLYPLTWGYSDFFVIPSACVSNFVHYLGVFAAMRQFVEIAIPTAVTLSCHTVVSLSDIDKKVETGQDGMTFIENLTGKYDGDFNKMMSDFPKDYLFYHPIKLSRWRNVL